MCATVVNFFAGPGAGKSTLAAGVFTLLKMHLINAELITEVAKDFTWEERYKTLKNQYYIWAKQQHRIWRIKNDVDVIVTDSPLILSTVYGEPKQKEFYDVVFNDYNECDNINYYIERSKPYQNKGRTQSEYESKEIDEIIKNKLKKYDIQYKSINGTIEGLNIVVCDVLEKLGKERLFFIGRYTTLR